MKEIPLTKGRVALVDDEDYEAVSGYKWHLVGPTHGKFYAGSHTNGKHPYLHRLLMKPGKSQYVDHINGDGLDNRRANLRICTNSQNIAHRNTPVKAKSGYRGVYPNGKRWASFIGSTKYGTFLHLGTFATKEEAARVRDAAHLKRYGEFARLNFPEAT